MSAINRERRKMIERLLALPVLMPVLAGRLAQAHEGHTHADMVPGLTKRSTANYEAPDVSLLDVNGNPVSLRAALEKNFP